MTSRTILDLDLKKVLSAVERRYGARLPRNVLAVDYGDRGDLYIRFRHVEKPVGEPSGDGLAVFFYEDDGSSKVAAVEVLDLGRLMRG